MLDATQKELSSLRIEMRKLLEPVNQSIATLQESVGSLSTVVAGQGSANYSDINNILDNSMPEWSSDAYRNLGILVNTAGDGNLECHNFYRLLVVDGHEELLIPVTPSATALKAPMTTGVEPAEHSLWLLNEQANPNIPRWDKVNGTMSIGCESAGGDDEDDELWDYYCPLPNDLVFPGHTYIFQLEMKLASDAPSPATQMFVGFYDNTGATPPYTLQRKFIEGGDFQITGETVGETGSSIVDYQILAKTDSNEQALSNIVHLTDAPAVFNRFDHPRIHFAGVAGFIQFLIYRKIGTTYVHQYTVNNTIEGAYDDIGSPPISTVPSFPSITTTKPRAYAATTNLQLTAEWRRWVFTIFVPTTYDRSKTAPQMQFLRFGLTAETDEPRQILMRRIGLSQGDGTWARSPNDIRSGAHSSPSTTAQGSAGGTSPGVPPPPETGGGNPTGGGCVLVESLVDVFQGGKKELRRLDREYLESGGSVHGRVRKLRLAHAARIYRIRTEGGLELGCTFDHPLITEPTDSFGTTAKRLRKRFDAGEEVWVLVRPSDEVVYDRIVTMEEEYGDFLVGEPSLDGTHIYITNGFLSHNKPSIDWTYPMS